MAFTSRGVIKRIEGAQGSEATAVQWRAVKYVGRIQRGEERPIPGWRWPAGARRPPGAERLISGLERIARGQTKSIVRRNPPGDAAALRKRIAGLQAARERRAREFQRHPYQSIHGRKAPRGMTTHGPGGKDAALTAAQRRAERLLLQRTRPGQRSLFERRNPRRKNVMAKRKRTPAQKAAFRRMLAGLARHKAGKRRKGRKGARARKAAATTTVVVSNPHRRKRRKNSRGGSIMAKRRRRSRTNPGRRHHRRRNPHRRHHRRHRNPGGGGVVSIVKSTIAAAIPSMAAGGLMALVDSKVLKDKAMGVQVVAKLALAGGAGYLLRSRPRTACLVMGAVMGGVAYQLVAQANGGVVAPDQQDAGKKMAALVYANRRMAALVNQNGTLRTQPSLSGMGQSMGDGGTALPTMPIYDPVNLG